MKSKLSVIVASLKEELTCALCQDVYDKPQALIPCLHTFCSECVNSIPRNREIVSGDAFSCPICRNTVNNHVNSYSIQNIIEIFKKAELLHDEISLVAGEGGGEDDQSSSSASTPTRIIESLNIDSNGPRESSSTANSFESVDGVTSSNSKKPCRSCRRGNGTNYTCNIPITESQQSGFGHIFCGFCSEYLPARGFGGNEPALNQCCSFCGIVACDEYWGCKNRDQVAKLYILSEITSIKEYLCDVDKIDSLEEGHLNTTEIRLLENYLNRSQLSWSEAWSTCLQDFNDNHYTTAIARRMTPLAQQLYNTRRLVNDNDGNSSFLNNNGDAEEEDDEEDDDDGYYDRISEEGILPSNHLRACYSCAVTIVNGQFYGYWRDILANGLTRDLRDKCIFGTPCTIQWTAESHATGFSHVEHTGEPSAILYTAADFDFF